MTDDADKRLEAALGYLQLGMFEEANGEVEQLPPEEKTSLSVLRLRAAIYSETKSWHLLREVAGFLVDSLPGDPQHWIWLAYATRRTTSIPAAETILLRALESHPSEAMIHFNLACYAAQTGKIEEAKERLRDAIRLAPETRLLALDDPDLEPLW
jgi:Tfp pilus assembly protein PilF